MLEKMDEDYKSVMDEAMKSLVEGKSEYILDKLLYFDKNDSKDVLY